MKDERPARLLCSLTDELARGGVSLAQLAGLEQPELDAWYAFALGRMDSGQNEEAAALLAGLLVMEPQDARCWRAYGIALQRLHRLERAVAAYTAAQVLEPEVAYLYLYRAEAFLLLRATELAKQDIAQARRLFETAGGCSPHEKRLQHLEGLCRQGPFSDKHDTGRRSVPQAGVPSADSALAATASVARTAEATQATRAAPATQAASGSSGESTAIVPRARVRSARLAALSRELSNEATWQTEHTATAVRADRFERKPKG